MALTVQNGSLVVRAGALGTEQACCCKKCEGPCDEENPCPEGCACVDGECVDAGACCLPDGTCSTEYDTQEECEDCTETNYCTEELYLDDPEAPCPEGWLGDGGFCYRDTTPATCEECNGDCHAEQDGVCGEWQEDGCPEQIECGDCTFEFSAEWNGLTVTGWDFEYGGGGLEATDEEGEYYFSDCVTFDTRSFLFFAIDVTEFSASSNCGCCEASAVITTGVSGNSYVWKATKRCGEESAAVELVDPNISSPCTLGFREWPEFDTPPEVTITLNCDNPLP